MAANKANIELVVLSKDAQRPSCPHGPTLLFERMDQTSKRLRQFYACSAFRDKKACSFFQWADQKLSKSEHSSRSYTEEPLSHKSQRERYFKFRKLPRQHRHICCTCGLLLVEEEECLLHERKGHSLRCNIGLRELKHPTTVFKPLDDNKTYAQYLFSKKTVDFVVNTLASLGYSHILCVGAPRIHEEVQFRGKSKYDSMTSMLLDLDDRYAQLYAPSLFTKYNMFNHHFFEKKGKSRLSQFLSRGKEHVVLLTDPPFGGMVEALSDSLIKISQMWNAACETRVPVCGNEAVNVMPLVWFFPYFMESRIVSQLPEIAMLDYKVDYDNHMLFNNQHKKKGSPVRIFTNIPQAKFVLPEEESYWFCQACQRFSSKENWHCSNCGSCTSKDGTRYVHCDVCMRCVKPSRVHCFTCQMCLPKDHTCGQVLSSGCHICGELGHKRRDCPHRLQEDKGNNRPHKREQKRRKGKQENIPRKKLKRR